jgi:glycosyltransferase involved in cell wall biosynthesis
MPLRVVGLMIGELNPGALGGAERTALEVWQQWMRGDDRGVCVLSSPEGEAAARRFGFSVPIETVRGPRGLRGRWRQAANGLSALFAVAGRRADFVMTSSAYFFDVLPAVLLKCRNPGCRLAIRLPHILLPLRQRPGSLLVNFASSAEQRLMLEVAKRFGDVMLIDNPLVRDALLALGFAPERLEYMPVGIRTQAPKPVDGGGDFDAVYVGRRSIPKGIPDLLEAWRIVTERLPNARLALVGYDEAGFESGELVRRLGLSGSVGCFEGLDDAQVAWMLAQARTAVTASREEGYGRVVGEAMAARRPVVTYDVPAFALFFPFGRAVSRSNDPAGLAGELISVLTDNERYAALQAEIDNCFKPRDWAQIAQNLWNACVQRGRER